MPFLLAAILWSSSGEVAVGREPLLAPIPIEVSTSGFTTIRLAAPYGCGNYVLVAGNLESCGVPTRVGIRRRASATTQGAHHHLAPTAPPDWWRWRVEKDRLALERARAREASAPETWAASRFAPQKTFHLFVGEEDLYDARRYVAVVANLVKVGRHCTLWADRDDVIERTVIEEIARVFDEQVYPSARATFGRHRDVDRDGKFAILLTGWLGRLSDGKVALSGFVRGADFYRDVEAPFSNQCDMLYLNASLEPGPHLTTILAHEYAHAITFCEHVFGEYLPGGQGKDDEAWLSEAVAHLAENLHGDGWTNLDYRVSTFLSRTQRYRLVVPDYFHEGLWRCHGCRGATYLFLRYCVDRFGEGILAELSQSNLAGIENIETVTQTPFAELFRGWSTWIATCGLVSRGSPIASLHGRLGDRLLAGARTLELKNEPISLELATTSFACLSIRLAQGEHSEITVDHPAGKDVQLTLVRLPGDLIHARALATPVPDSSRIRLRLASSRAVTWREIACECLDLIHCPPGLERTSRIIAAADVLPSVVTSDDSWSLESDEIDLVELQGRAAVVKAVGVDDEGRPVSAWTVVPPSDDATPAPAEIQP